MHVARSFGMPIITVIGSGAFFLEGVVQYVDGGVFNWVSMVTVREGKLAEEVSYWAAPFDPPEWRRPFVEA